MSKVISQFKKEKRDKDWSFEGERSHNILTHGYHRYPAKFVPQLVRKILNDYPVKSGEIVCDPFAGCGTTLVEAKVKGITSIGVDVNPVAQLITKAKIKPLEPKSLSLTVEFVTKKMNPYLEGKPYPKSLKFPKHERLDYWFDEETKKDIAMLFLVISKVTNKNHQTFLYCALSNILKDSSRWLQSSTKPQIDPNKNPKSAIDRFFAHLKVMTKKNTEFYNLLKEEGNLKTESKIILKDARNTEIKSNSISRIITSPPYVTSYEYADIHQLSGYWFEYIKDITKFRKQFIGSSYIESASIGRNSFPELAQKTLNKLEKKDKRVAKEVMTYFADMQLVAKEMSRILKKDGLACIVIGNTTLKDVHIQNAEVLAEMLLAVDLTMERIIKRSIPNKIIPTIRNKTTGRFAKKASKNSKMVYPEEYILIFKKT